MFAGGLPSFTITSESQTFEVPPELNITLGNHTGNSQP